MSKKIDKDKIVEGLEAVKTVYPDIFGESSSFVDDFNKMLEVISHNPSEKMKKKAEQDYLAAKQKAVNITKDATSVPPIKESDTLRKMREHEEKLKRQDAAYEAAKAAAEGSK